MYGLQVRKLVIVRVDARTEEESCVAPVDDLVVAELDEVGLVFLVSGGDKAVDLWQGESADVVEGVWQENEG
jgi:hypothetical protein